MNSIKYFFCHNFGYLFFKNWCENTRTHKLRVSSPTKKSSSLSPYIGGGYTKIRSIKHKSRTRRKYY